MLCWQSMNHLTIRGIAAALVLFLGVLSAEEETFTINGKDIIIPVPEGFARVTEEMPLVRELAQQADAADKANDTLAYFIERADVAAALAGEMPELDRTFSVAVTKELRNVTVGKDYFAKLKKVLKEQNQKIHKGAMAQVPEFAKKFSEGVSEDFNLDFSLKIPAMVPLAPHHETENAISSSTYISFSSSSSGERSGSTSVNTQTLVNVAGSVVMLNCDAPGNQVAWTRGASMRWLESVVASNNQPLTHSHELWSRLRERGAGVGLAVLMAAGALWLIKKKCNKSGETS